MKPRGAYARIYRVVSRIPPGRVATYGQIAKLAGLPGHARQVGYALHRLPGNSAVPWHRVLNHKGQISLHSDAAIRAVHRMILEKEGVVFERGDAVVLKRYQWRT